jgi:anti-sigma B factor antagonist
VCQGLWCSLWFTEHHPQDESFEEAGVDVSVTSRVSGDQTVVDVTGEIDVYTAPVLREELASLIDSERTDLVVDLTSVGFMDSTGLGVLVGALKKVRTLGGDLRLVISEEKILKVFKITALTQVFTIYASIDEALQS